MEKISRKIDYEAVTLTEKIKSQQSVRIIMSDNDVICSPIKWFTATSLGLSDGRIITRSHIKIIETEPA